MYEVLEFIANYEIRFREDEVKHKENDHFLKSKISPFKYTVITTFGVEKHFVVGKILTFVYLDGKVLVNSDCVISQRSML